MEEHEAIATDYKVNDLTDKGKMYVIIFQTFAFLQIFNILNARRPSFRDINPLKGISVKTVTAMVLMLVF